MRKFLTVLIVLIVLGGGGYLIYKNGNDTTPTPTPANTSTPTPDTSSPTTSPSSTSSSVTIADMAFSPNEITVKKGTKVTWTNQDSTAHTVTGDKSDGPSSSTLSNGQTYSFTFNTAGTFSYHCSIHSSMTGTVTVTE